ncbi:CBO0543 family protein [Neobacillus dielmonensis]|uniref:CBO0543 family protein n=1 Tax=Neobacillus dielmonensis TaxID=1347369 RepID=UPI0029E7F0E6|nr:CBO0543 family protein [Neobacillus dielmonensis]
METIYSYVSSVVLAFIAYKIPKKIKPYEIYATSLFSTLFGLLVDSLLETKYRLYLLDKPGIQIPPLVAQVVFYAATNVIILNSFPYHKSTKRKIVYIFCFTLLAVAFEFISYKFKFIKYNEWKIGYSALCYPFLIYLLVIHFRFFQWLVKRTKSS